MKAKKVIGRLNKPRVNQKHWRKIYDSVTGMWFDISIRYDREKKSFIFSQPHLRYNYILL